MWEQVGPKKPFEGYGLQEKLVITGLKAGDRGIMKYRLLGDAI